VTLVGRRDEPTDGVEDYCACLGKVLTRRGIHIEVVRVPWAERGWIEALLKFGRQSALWKKRYVLVQYTALGWSRRGFPIGLLPLLFLLRYRRVSFGVVYHDTSAYPGTRFVDRIRRATQRFVMKRIAIHADRVIMPANPENLTWLTVDRSKVTFMPVGSNVPAPSDRINDIACFKATERTRPRTIAVFSITDGKKRRENEVAVIRELMRVVATRISGVRFCVFGRGAKEAEPELRQAVYETGIELSVFGLLPAEEIGEILSQADVQIDVRAPISSRRGSVVAGIVCNTPVVGFESSETDAIVREAGVVLVPFGDIDGLAAAVIRILSDDSFRKELRLRSETASHKYFSWDAISEQLLRALRPALPKEDETATDRKYKILLVCTHPVQYASPVFRHMALDSRLDILVAYCSLQGAEASVDEEFEHKVVWDVPLLDGYPWIRVQNRAPRPGLGRFFGLINPGLWKVVCHGGYDAVLLFTGYSYCSFWIALLAAKLTNTAVLFGTDATSIQARVPAWWKPLIKRFVLSRIYRLADGKWAASAAGKEYLKSLKVPDEHISIAPLVVDNNWWTARTREVDRSAMRRSWGVLETAPVVLFCAKLQPWKRPQDLLRAFGRARVPEAHLVVAGTGPLASTLASEAEQLGLSDRVHFIGFQNQTDLPAIYCAADLFVLPSEYDACPAVVCEAMLCGLPVILSDEIRGRFELIDPGRTGFIFKCRDVENLTRLLREAIADPVRLATMGTAAREAMKNCSPETNVRGVVRLLDQVLLLRKMPGQQNDPRTRDETGYRPECVHERRVSK
jgi:glycosyltransferase involved in cell wall biosynthesis